MFNYNHLFYFYSVARYGGVTKAAQILNVSQPSLTAQIKVLEEHLKMKLLRKSGRNIVLTHEGKIVFDFCQRMFEISSDLEEFVTGRAKVKGQRLRLGVTSEVERPFISDAVSEILKGQGEQVTSVSMITDSHSKLMEALLKEEIQIFFTGQVVIDPLVKAVLEIHMPVIPVVSSKLFRDLKLDRKKLSLQQTLEKVGLILPAERLLLRYETDIFFQRQRLKGKVKFESDVISTLIRSSLEGVGVSFLPKNYVRKELQDKRLMCLPGHHSCWTHTIRGVALVSQVKSALIKQIKTGFILPNS